MRDGLPKSDGRTTDGNGVSDQGQPVVRPAVPDQRVGGETIVRDSESEVLPGAGPDTETPKRLAAEVFDVAGRIEQKMASAANKLADEVQAVCSKIQAAMSGYAGVIGDDVIATCNKLRDKMERAERTKAATMYAYWQNARLPLPTADSVPYYLATGDAVGAIASPAPLAGASGNDGLAPGGPLPVPPGGTVGTGVQPGSAPMPPSGTGGTQAGITPGVGGTPTAQPIPGPNPNWMNCPPGLTPTPYGCADPCTTDAFRDSPFCTGQQSPGGAGGQDTSGGQTDTGGPTIQPSSCPPGYMPASTENVTATVPAYSDQLQRPPSQPKGTNDPGQAAPSEAATFVPCSPPVTGGWVGAYSPNVGEFGTDGEVIAPWIDHTTTPPNVLAQHSCVPHCSRADRGPDVHVNIPAGWDIYVPAGGGQVVAANHPVPGYVRVPSERCTTLPSGTAGPGTGEGWTQGGGGPPPGACVPAPPPDEVCIPPKQVTCGPDLNKTIKPLKFSDDDACQSLKDAVKWINEQNVELPDHLGMGWGGKQPPSIGKAILAALTGTENSLLPDLINRTVKWAKSHLRKAIDAAGCPPADLANISTIEAVFGLFGGWFGLVPDQVLERINQISHTICHVILPSGAEANAAYLADAITDAVWECWVKAAGLSVQEARTVRDSERSRADIKGVFDLFRRKHITEETRDKLLRELGVTKDEDRERLWKLTEQIPQFADLIRLIVRDVFNDQTVADARLDDGFDTNYMNSELARNYGLAAGVPDDLARMYWRAHWQIPSYSMLREMLFRLRPGEVDPKLALDREGVRKALMQDDWAPGFVDRMIETAYLPINRTDFTRIYFDHVIDDDELKKRYMSVGYNEKDAEVQVADMRVRRRINDYKTGGFPSIVQLVQMYGRCEIDHDTLLDGVQKQSVSDEQTAAALEGAEIRRNVRERQSAIKTVTREFKLGLISEGEASSRLSEQGVDSGCVPGLVRAMRGQRARQSKYVSAQQLCKMRDHGIITPMQQLEALIRQGWDAQDADRIVAECSWEIDDRQRKAMEKAAAKAAKEKDKADKAAAKAAKTGPKRKSG